MSYITSDYWWDHRIREQLPKEQLIILCLDNICYVFEQGHALGEQGNLDWIFRGEGEVPGDLQWGHVTKLPSREMISNLGRKAKTLHRPQVFYSSRSPSDSLALGQTWGDSVTFLPQRRDCLLRDSISVSPARNFSFPLIMPLNWSKQRGLIAQRDEKQNP